MTQGVAPDCAYSHLKGDRDLEEEPRRSRRRLESGWSLSGLGDRYLLLPLFWRVNLSGTGPGWKPVRTRKGIRFESFALRYLMEDELDRI